MVKNPLASGGDIRDWGSIPGSGRSPGGGNGKPLQYSCPENPMDRGAWWGKVHRGRKELDITEHTYITVFNQFGVAMGKGEELVPWGRKGQNKDHLAGNTRWVVGEMLGPRIGMAVTWGHELSL